MTQPMLSVGLADPVHQSQAAFRSALDALARPGRRVTLGTPVDGLALDAAMAHLLLTLTDDDTLVWWQQGDAALADWLRFHTGAPRAAESGDAAFAVVVDAAQMPALNRFATGSAECPEHSATLLVALPSLDDGPAVEWRGPGIADVHTVRLAGLQDDFWGQWQLNHAAFPQGVDLIFICGNQAIGLPRTTRVRRLEGVA